MQPSHWKLIPSTKLTDRAKAVQTLAQQHRSELEPFGLTSASLGEFKQRIDAYERLALAPRSAVTHRKTLTGTLDQELRKLADLLDHQVNPLLLPFAASAPEFYAAYQNARVTVQPARTPMETIRERALAKAAMAATRKEAKAARRAAKAAAQEAIKAQKRSRLSAIAEAAAAFASSRKVATNGASPVAAGRNVASGNAIAALPN